MLSALVEEQGVGVDRLIHLASQVGGCQNADPLCLLEVLAECHASPLVGLAARRLLRVVEQAAPQPIVDEVTSPPGANVSHRSPPSRHAYNYSRTPPSTGERPECSIMIRVRKAVDRGHAAPVLALGCTSLNFVRNGKPNAAAVHDLGSASSAAWSSRRRPVACSSTR